eukprot:5508281-Pyramimonas_sp.AAC.2
MAAGGKQGAVGRERNPRHGAAVLRPQPGQALAAVRVPHPRGAVESACRKKAAVVAGTPNQTVSRCQRTWP